MAGQPQQLLSLLLQRGDASNAWGFAAVKAGAALTVQQVSNGTVGAHYLAPGDVILRLGGRDPAELSQDEVDAAVAEPGTSLELLVMKAPRSRLSRSSSVSSSGVSSPVSSPASSPMTGTFPRYRLPSVDASSSGSYFQRGTPSRRSSQTAFLREMFEQTAVAGGGATQHHSLRRQTSLGVPRKTSEFQDVTQRSLRTYSDGKVGLTTTSPPANGYRNSADGILSKGFWQDEVQETPATPNDLSERRIKFAEALIDEKNDDVFYQSLATTNGNHMPNENGTQWNPEEDHLPLGVPKTKPPGSRGRKISPVSQQDDRHADFGSSEADSGAAPGSLQRTRSRKSLQEIFPVQQPSLEENGRQSSQISGGGSPSPGPGTPAGDGVSAAPAPPPFPAPAPPAPPPPPPPGAGALPAVRIATEIPDTRTGGRIGQTGNTYEPPAAIQNAMMTKDKKPFTYTPGGLDLSQIRSPRMQRRITRNANAEGVPEQPVQQKTSPLAHGQLPPSALAAMQPQMPVAVFPTGNQQMSPPVPPPPPPQPQVQTQPQVQKAPVSPPHSQPQVQKVPVPPPQPQPVNQNQATTQPPQWSQTQAKPASPQSEPGSIYIPPVVQPQGGRAQVGSIYIPPVQQQQQDQQKTASPLSPVSLNKAPTPWMSQRPQQQQVPTWVNRDETPVQRQPSAAAAPTPTPTPTPAPSGTRIIPIQVEGRDAPVQANKSTPSATNQQTNTRIIPIQIEGEPAPSQSKPSAQQHVQQRQPVYVHNKFNPSVSPTSPTPSGPGTSEIVAEHNPRQLQQQQSWGPPGANGAPIQSRSFRVLQKITDTDNTDAGNENSQHMEYPYGNQSTQGVPVQQLRKLQLSEDDRALMNRFKAQVPPAPAPSRGPPQRPASVQPATESPQPYIPPSEQQVQEPKKYTGGCIPSRSFRMLQAMTAPENCASAPSSDECEAPVSVSHQGYDENAAGQWYPYDPNMSPVPPYWGPEAWWRYYPVSNLEGQKNSQAPSPHYWDPYSAMYAYMAEMAAYGYPPPPYPPVYSPHHFAPSRQFRYPHSGSDSDECSGYSSTDEMAYYGANFAHGIPQGHPPVMLPHMNHPSGNPRNVPEGNTNEICKNEKENLHKIVTEPDKTSESVTPKCNEANGKKESTNENDSSSSEEDDTSDSDTEVEDENRNEADESAKSSSNSLQMIRSVSDINVYNNNSGSDVLSHSSETNDDETEREEDSDGDDEFEEVSDRGHYNNEEETCLPHQLSVIFEESECSDVESTKRIHSAEKADVHNLSEDGDSSTATLDNCEDDSDVDYDAMDPGSSTVTVRLPLKLKFSRSENDEEVTTLIVGDSQVKRIPKEDEVLGDTKLRELKPNVNNKATAQKEADVSVTVCLTARSSSNDKVEQWKQDVDKHFNQQDDITKKEESEISKLSRHGSLEDNLNRQRSASDLDVYETAESDSDISVCLSLPLKKTNNKKPQPPKSHITSENLNNVSEEDDDDGKVKGDDSDCAFSHWEDDSSSTSIQTVKLAPHTKKLIGSNTDDEKSNKTSEAKGVTTKETKDKGEQNRKVQSSNKIQEISTYEQRCDKEDEHAMVNTANHELEDTDTSEDESSSNSESISSISSSSSTRERNISIKPKEKVESPATNYVSERNSKSENTNNNDSSDITDKILNIVTDSKIISNNETFNKLENSQTQPITASGTHRGNQRRDSTETNSQGRNEMRTSNSKSQEESEEDDSGVTSDLSRPISDADTESELNLNELQLLSKCQRAATHSRLFKLLQDECGKEDEENDEDDDKAEDLHAESVGTLKSRKDQLTLPLRQNSSSDPDSLSSSSGIGSPASPTITDRLVKELIRSLLQKKKGKRLKKLPLAKLHAAALRILQEDMDPYDTVSSPGSEESNGFCLPSNQSCFQTQHSINYNNNNANTANSNIANPVMPPTHAMYGANYYDYCNYYDSWGNQNAYYGTDQTFEYDVVPSKAFKLLQEHTQPHGFSTGLINGLWAKCPRIPSSKNLPKDLASAETSKENKAGSQSDPLPEAPVIPENESSAVTPASAQAS
ncbi:uncharacterized protein LOC126362232 isoform X4 [Schistocerca gregaria]|uniref:uncharacterized protein LOC126362232 isoform X4 n=1 Tax=Schistocerca gregaria TaxID=7010 RepID=UPI00211F40EE|nr:uncharacterized protein LOC126362232 isoform X4 [Schistocerca gregaria]